MAHVIERQVQSKEEAQALCQFLYNEYFRHIEDTTQILDDLDKLKETWGVSPRAERAFVRP